MKNLLSFLFLLLLNVSFFSQKAHVYYPLIQQAEQHIIHNNLDSALIIYDKAFEEFDYPFYNNILQASVVAFYAKNDELLKKYLTICIKRGMPKKAFMFFEQRKSSNSVLQELSIKYNEFHEDYINSIDKDMRNSFLEFDAIDHQVHPKDYSNNQEVRDKLYAFEVRMAKKYIEMIDSIGFPTEKKVGLSWVVSKPKFRLFNKKRFHKMHHLVDIYPRAKNKYLKITELKNALIWEWYRPGNFFLAHFYHQGEKIDTLLMKKLEEGFLNLEVNPITIIRHEELLCYLYTNEKGQDVVDDGFENIESDCAYACTFFSSHNLEIGWTKKYSLSSTQRAIINKARQKYYIRSLDTEEGLLYALYNLEFGETINEFKSEFANKVGFQLGAFLNYN